MQKVSFREKKLQYPASHGKDAKIVSEQALARTFRGQYAMSQSDALRIPDAAKKDAKSMELLRVWVADHDQHVSLRVGVWEDPFAWGVVLADLANHIANAFQQHSKLDRAAVLARIEEGFDAEMAGPTEDSIGEVVE
jgi:hypothetical protein